MLISFGMAKRVLSLLPLVAVLGATPGETPQHVARIRVSQEATPGDGKFDSLGVITALQTDGNAADFYMMGKKGPNYGNPVPKLTPSASHLFFVNAKDGLALFVVEHATNGTPAGNGGTAATKFELSGGKAKVLLSDDGGEGTSQGDTVFIGKMDWASPNTDGMVIGPLPAGSTIVGQFTAAPKGLDKGWIAISGDSTTVPLKLVVGQRVRFEQLP